MNEGVVFEDSLSGTILNSEILKQFSWQVVGIFFFLFYPFQFLCKWLRNFVEISL